MLVPPVATSKLARDMIVILFCSNIVKKILRVNAYTLQISIQWLILK